MVYCNVEGLDFLNEDLLIAASDQMKNAGRQNSRCLAKDQSIHVFGGLLVLLPLACALWMCIGVVLFFLFFSPFSMLLVVGLPALQT